MGKTHPTTLFLASVLVCLGAVCVSAGNRRGPNHRGRSNRQRSAQQQQRQQAQRREAYLRQLREAALRARAIQEAQAKLAAAERRYKQLKSQLEDQYRHSPAIKSAIRARANARDAYLRERERVEKELAKSDAHQRLQEELAFVEDQIGHTKEYEPDNKTKLAALVREKGSITSALARQISEAISRDPDASVARAKYESATARLRSLKKEIPQALANSPKLNKALADVQQARMALARAYAGRKSGT